MGMPHCNINMKKTILVIIILCLWSCISEIQEPQEIYMTISDFQADYDQLANKIFLQVATETENDTVADVQVQIIANDFPLDTIFTLNDSAQAGDLIAMNGIYSGNFDILLSFQEYQLRAVAQTHSGIEMIYEKNIQVEEQFLPEIVDITFQKKYGLNGCGYEFDYNNSHYYINDEDTSYLNFQIRIKDLNGLENIQSIRYQTITNWFYAEGVECPNQGSSFLTSPAFYMTNIASNDSILTYEAINDYIKEPGFPINPLSVCNRFGVVTFTFIAIDIFYGPYILDNIDLIFSNCSEGAWNAIEDCNNCPLECGDCE